MLQQGHHYGLQRVYALLQRLPLGLREMEIRLSAHIQAKGSDLMAIMRDYPKEKGSVFIEVFTCSELLFKSELISYSLRTEYADAQRNDVRHAGSVVSL